MKLILDAPVDFVVQVLGSWLTLKDLCNLDSAVCSAERRLSLGVIYESLSVEVQCIENVPETEKQLDWLLIRKIRLSSLQNDYRLPRNTFSKVAALLKHSGKQLQRLYLTDNDALMATVAATIIRYCTRLEVLTVRKMELNSQLFAMCGSLYGLKELQLSWCRCINVRDIDIHSIFCPSLSSLLLSGNFPIKTQKEMLRMCPNLVNYSLSYTDEVELCDLPSTLKSVLIFDCETVHVLNINESLKKLRVTFTAITDEGVAKIFTSCSHLQELSLANNRHITDVTLKQIGDVFGGSLTSLDLCECESITEHGLKYVCEKCTILVHLTVAGYEEADPPFITTALDSLPSLRSLNISQAVVTDALLTRVAAAVSLDTLDVTYIHGCTEKGIMALVKGCTSLKKIFINDELVTPLVSLMWKELRPELRIELSE